MKKITRILILSIVMLAFLSPQTGDIHASMTSARQAPNLRPARTTIEAQPVAAEDSDWVIECVDCPKQFDNASMRLDSEGYPHIAYGGENLYYAWHDGTEWQYETVDDSNFTGSNISLALDIYGYPHISYCSAGQLKYAYKDATNWTEQMVDSEVIGCIATSLTLDSDRKPHIIYKEYDGASSKLKYAFLDVSGWQIKIVDNHVDDLGAFNILLDQQDQPHMIYTVVDMTEIIHAYQDTTGWHTETVDIGICPQYFSMVLDVDGNPHISYHNNCFFFNPTEHHYELMYAYKDTEGWQVQMVDSEWHNGDTFLTFDNNGEPNIYAYHHDNGLVHAYREGDEWDIQALGYMEGFTSMNLDTDGYLHFLTKVDILGDFGDLVYTSQDVAGWNTQTVDSQDEIYGSTSLALDEYGYPHISYRNISDGGSGIMYAYQNASGWHIQLLDSTDIYGFTTSLVLNEQGYPHISYDDWNKNELKYAFKDYTGWHYQTIDFGGFPSLALDAHGKPHISYRDSSAEAGDELKYAYYDKTGWTIQSLEKGSLIFPPSLSVDSSGFPHIVYIIDDAIRYAYQDVNGWNFETVEEDDQFRSYKSAVLGLDFNDIPRIGYIWSYSGKGGYFSGIIYDGDEIIRNDLGGSYNGLSLDLDTNGNPHLIYRGDTPTDSIGGLIYAHKVADSSWSFEVVGDIGDDYNSLSVDKQGNPHISYIDYRSEDLKYAHIAYTYLLTLSPTIDYNLDFPGSSVTSSLSIHNRGTVTDSYSISTSGFHWPTEAPATVGPLAGGESTTIDIQVQIPVTATMGMRDTATITVTSQADSSKTSVAEVITLVGKATFLPLVQR